MEMILNLLFEMSPTSSMLGLEKIKRKLLEAFEALELETKREFERIKSQLGNDFSRKDFALVVQQQRHPSLLFAILDGQDYTEQIWRKIKPTSEEVFRLEY